MQGFLNRPSVVFCGLLIMLNVLAAGCASKKYGEQVTTVSYYPQCYAPIQALRDADKDFNNTVIASTAIGAVGGAALGFLYGRGRARDVAVGAAVGGLAGAGFGYAKAKQDRIADDNKRMASYLADLEGDISGIDRASAAARTARDCYANQFNQAVADYKAGKMARAELTARYAEIKNGCSEADEILGAVIAGADDKERDYQAALESEAKLANRPVPAAAPAPAKAKPAAAKPAPKSAAASPAQTDKPVVQKTAAPRQGDNSLEAVALNTQRLGESKQSAMEEREAMRKMQAEMDGMLATVLS